MAAVTATGVPKPAAPSKKAPKQKAMNRSCSRRSSEMLRMTALQDVELALLVGELVEEDDVEDDPADRHQAEAAIHLVATTGTHTARWYSEDHWSRTEPATALEARFVADLTTGADGTEHRCGVIKVATLGESPDPVDRGQFEAAAEAHRTDRSADPHSLRERRGRLRAGGDVLRGRRPARSGGAVAYRQGHRSRLPPATCSTPESGWSTTRRYATTVPSPTRPQPSSPRWSRRATPIRSSSAPTPPAAPFGRPSAAPPARLAGHRFAEILEAVGWTTAIRQQILVTNPANWLDWG